MTTKRKRERKRPPYPENGGYKPEFMKPPNTITFCRCAGCGGKWFVEAYGIQRHLAHAGLCLHLACMVRTYRPAREPEPVRLVEAVPA